MQTNVLGTAVMLNCAKAAWELPDGTFKEGKKFLHVSTDEVYGSLENDGEYFYETTPYAPHSPYSASKASSDMLVKAYMDTYKFPANITNCSNNYGPYQFPEKLIPLIINNALHGKKLPVYGDGKNVRDWLFVEDHAKAIDMVQEKGRLFETYNVGGHNEKQNIEIIEIIIETLQEMLPDSDPRKKLVSKDLITYVKVEDKVCVMNKFKDLKSATYNTVGNDQIILRYADVLLMYAEALNEISYSNSQTSDAMVALNAVHTRAGLSPVQITELADQDSFRKAIMLERQQEFPYEGQRWFDLVRMGGAKEAMKAEGHIIQDYQFLYPIPKTELERINNTELLWQNTGY